MSKERRQALRNHHTSTFGKTYSTTKSRRDSCEGGNEEEDSPTKSQKSLSSHQSSSDEADGTGGMLSKRNEMIDGRGTSASRRNTPSRISALTGNYSTTKSTISNTHGTSASRRSSTRKYSPVVVGDHDDDEDDYDDEYLEKAEESLGSVQGTHGGSTGGGTSSSDADDYAPVTLRHVTARGGIFSGGSRPGSNLTLNDFVRSHWKEVSTPEEDEEGHHGEGSSSEEIAQNGTSPSRKSSNGYAVPVDSLLRPNHQPASNKRPESWSTGPSVGHPQSNLFYRTPSIVPSHWINKRELPLARSVGGPPFGRSTMIVCPSRLTAEVTYIRRM